MYLDDQPSARPHRRRSRAPFVAWACDRNRQPL